MLSKLFQSKSAKRTLCPSTAIEPLEDRKLLSLAAAYFARPNLTATKYAEADAQVNFNWTKTGTPSASKLGTDGFSVRWSGTVLAKFSEYYTFIARSAGGVRVWVNNQLLIDKSTEHTYESDGGTIKLAAGKKYDIRVDYTSAAGQAPQIQLLWNSTRTPKDLIPANRLLADSLSTAKPDSPTRFRASVLSSTSAKVTWTGSTASTVAGYDVYVGSTKVATTLPTETSYTRSNLTAGQNYTFSVQAVTSAGILSNLVTTAVVTAGNGSNTAPSTPTNLTVGSATSSSLTLNWSASSDNAGGVSYRVYRNGVKLSVAPTATSYTDTGLSAGTTYTYKVLAIDAGGLASGYSSNASGTTSSVSSTRSALSTVSAASYSSGSGISKSGSTINSLDSNDYAAYANLNFGSAGAKSVVFNIAGSTSIRGGSIELHLDSTGGQSIGTFTIDPTGSTSTFYSQKTNITTTTGTHTLYLVFKNMASNAAALNSFVFSNTHLTRVMALGDSITQESGGETNHTTTWRNLLQQMLNGAGKTDYDFVGSQTAPWEGTFSQYGYDQDNEGHAGFRADQIASQITGWASANVPDIVLLQVGINDLFQGRSASDTAASIGQIIDNLRSVNPNVKIGLAEITPSTNADVTDLNNRIATLASQKNSGSSPVTLVNQTSGFNPAAGSNTFDGLHPNDSGDQLVASKWYAYLSGVLS